MMKKRGFTLIELLVVISIIGILVAIAVTSYLTASKQSRDTKRKTDLEQIRQALETYRSQNGVYPSSSTWQIDLTNGYITTMPSDPSTGIYYYVPGSLATTYSLCATLEIIPVPPFTGCGDATYNYEVKNP